MLNNSIDQLVLSNFSHLVASCIIYYDHIITFVDEYDYVWSNPRSGASILFLLNRYVAVCANIVTLWSHFAPLRAVETCAPFTMFSQVILIVTQVIVALIQFLKTLALYGQDRRVAGFILSIACILTGLSIWSIFRQEAHVSTAVGCHKEVSQATGVRIAVAWEALFAYDLMIFAFTVFRTWQDRQLYEKPRAKGLMSLIVRDGAIYFAVMACAQCANTLTFYLLPPALRGVLSTFASSISVTMMSRFLLRLFETAAERQKWDMDKAGTTFQQSDTTATVFTTRIAIEDDLHRYELYQ